MLLRQTSKIKKGESDKYGKQDEVLGIIANNTLALQGIDKFVKFVCMCDSKDRAGLQAVDILTGAINSGFMKFLNPNLTLSIAKEAAFPRLAQMISWDSLIYDTYPNKSFNIWHFPGENRGVPATKPVKYQKVMPVTHL